MIKQSAFVVQKYIERPLLINNRKFDIRVWVLLDYNYDVYFFKEGYLRTSSSEYNPAATDDLFVHLTNYAVQKYANNYGTYEDGNQLTFRQFQEILQKYHTGRSLQADVLPQIKRLITKSLLAVAEKLDPFKRAYSFELFGYDFILDQDFNTWLIECNTNPCLEESSLVTKGLVPRMIEDMMRIVVDGMFPAPEERKNEAAMRLKKNKPRRPCPVEGYSNKDNLW